MLNSSEILGLIPGGKSDRLAFTSCTANTTRLAQTVCAFANDMPGHRKPGYLIVGVNTGGSPCGLAMTAELLQQLNTVCLAGDITPAPVVVIGTLPLADGEVAVVQVEPSATPPVRYMGQVWIRVGPRKALASEQELRLLATRCAVAVSRI